MKRSNQQRGETDGFAMILAVVVLVVIGLGSCWAKYSFSGEIRQNAQTDARRYAHEFHPAWAHTVVVCQSVDSDGDGYVTCTIGDGANTTEALECRTSIVFDYQRGCRPMRAAVRTSSND